MKRALPFLMVAGALALVGCASTPTQVDRGPIQARTFSFMDMVGKAPAAFADARPELHPRIQEAITKTLAAKGLTKVASGGDVAVGYLIIVSDGITTSSLDAYFGHSTDTVDLQEKAHRAFAVGNKNPTAYPAGTLVIDIADGKSYRLLQRHSVCRPIMRQLPMDERVARLQEAVDEALQGLRVAK